MGDSGHFKKSRAIRLFGVKQNNLKNIDIEIPLGSFTVICGPSGSGKSSLAFETLYAEGQRRYIESLSNYARQFLGKAPKPDLDGVENIPPAIAIEQKNSVKTSRSTVGTTTEIIDYLRLLFEKAGSIKCPTYGFPIQQDSVTSATENIIQQVNGQRGYILAPILSHGRANAEKRRLHQQLLADGYLRLFVDQTSKKNLSLKETKGSLKKAKITKKSKTKKVVLSSSLSSFPPCLQDQKTTGEKNADTNKSFSDFGEIIELQAGPNGAREIPDGDFYIVIDRLTFAKDDQGRVSDSMAQAYSASLKYNSTLTGGRAKVLTTEGIELSFSEENSCSKCGFVFPNITSQLFSFNSPIGACSKCNGFGNLLALDEDKIVPNPNLSIADGALHPFTMPSAKSDLKALLAFCKKQSIDIRVPWKDLANEDRLLIWNGHDQFYGVVGLFDYLETKKYKMHVRVFLSRYKSATTCPECLGSRLKKDHQFVKIDGHSFTDLSSQTVQELAQTINNLSLSPAQQDMVADVMLQLKARLSFLMNVGVQYLTLDRPTKTLSGGEYQRLNLAKQLGMGLSQTLYVLDEPTVGLHPRDNDRLISTLKGLNQLGNTLVVVEHDREVIANSQHVLEIGPGSGYLGGNVVFAGNIEEFKKSNSLTASYLLKPNHSIALEAKKSRPTQMDSLRYKLEMMGCTGNNLKNINLEIPLHRLVTVTGVSGSGKSSLISQTLYPALARELQTEFLPGLPYKELKGQDAISNVLFIDQGPIGKTARSNPLTYLKIYDTIRTLFSATPEAKLRGYNPGTFSLNVDGGRCPICKGLGFEVIDMMFMDDVILSCDACDGKRFRREVLEVTYKNKNIWEVLNLTVAEAMDFFIAHPSVRKPLSFLKEVGLDYLRLGQSASTLSGGESQRLKIAREFMSAQNKATLYILDEPTTGLHFREVELLLKVLHKLIDAGGSVVLIEHNLEIMRASDFIIDLGPEAGQGGGEIVAQGPPDAIANNPLSLTGHYLRS